MKPIVDGLEQEFQGRAAVVQLDAALPANAKLLDQYGLRGHPSFAVLAADGQIAERYFGPQSEATLRQALEGALQG